MELIIVRHGETEWTISGQYTGTTDLPLTPKGHRQAVSLRPLLAGVLAGRHPAIYTSPRQRALDTARLAFPMLSHESSRSSWSTTTDTTRA